MAEETKEVKVPTGMVEFTYAKAHGTRKKDEVVVMHRSTAEALANHKVGKATKTLTRIEKKEGQA